MAHTLRKDGVAPKARGELAGLAWGAIAIGALLTVVPPMLSGPTLADLASTLQPAGWVALGVGAVLLLLRFWMGRPAAKDSFLDDALTDSGLARLRREPAFTVDPVFEPDTIMGPTPIEPAPPTPATAWGPQVLADIEWPRFEAVCEAFYAQVGLSTRAQSHGHDGGVDISLQSRHMDTPRIVRCKHWKDREVDLKEVRDFHGVMASQQLTTGTFVTSGTFTSQATAFAREHGILLQDGAALLKLIGQRTPDQQAALLAVAYEGEFWRAP